MPLLDVWLENQVRRALVRRQLTRRLTPLGDDDLAALADKPWWGCRTILVAVLIWPIKKILRTIFFVWEMKVIADLGADVWHRAALLEVALDEGWVPGDAAQVRAAMDAAVAKVGVRILQLAVNSARTAGLVPAFRAEIARLRKPQAG